MNAVQVESKKITGISTRTKNVDELNASTAKIASLWGQFFSRFFLNLSQGAQAYGVYHDYESDYSGEFSLLAGCDESAALAGEGLEEVAIEAGEYLRFSGKGGMPQTVLKVWTEVWEHFSKDDCAHQRAYKTDFEHYKSANEVDIYISIS